MGKKKKKKLTAAERSERRLPPDPRPAPWLVYTHGQGMTNQTFFNLCDQPITQKLISEKPITQNEKPITQKLISEKPITENEKPITQNPISGKPITVNPTNGKTYPKCIPEVSGKSFWQSPTHDGWLIIICDDSENEGQYSNSKWKLGDCFLWNPVSLETIELPSLSRGMNTELREYYIRGAVLSCSPSNPDDDPMVFLIYAGIVANYIILCCRPKVQREWTGVGLPIPRGCIRSFFCFKGTLHLSCYGKAGEEVTHIEIVKLPVHSEEIAEANYLYATHEPFVSMLGMLTPYKDNFVVSRDEIFKIVRIYHPSDLDKGLLAIEIFRMDFSIRTWVKVESLGNHVLFFSDHATASCLAEEMGLTRGCLYFTQPNDKSLYTFDLEGDSVSVVVPCPNLPTPWSSPNWIMMPTMTRIADGKRAEDVLNNEEESIIIEALENIRVTVVDEEEEESQKINRAELEDSGTWGTLNDGILVSIASFLHPVDYLHFRAVSREYRSAIPAVNWRTTSTDIIQSTSLSPWLVFTEKDDPIYNFVDPMHDNDKYHMNLSEYMLDAKICFSKGGWLLMSRGKKTVFFFNPFTRERITLPDFADDDEYMFYGICFSSSPTSADCIVFAITEWGKDKVFIFYISRGDPTWSIQVFNNTRLPSSENCVEFVPSFNSPVFHNGAFYCLGYEGLLGKFELGDPLPSWKVLANPQLPCNSVSQNYLVECEGRLLSVFLGHLGSQVRIYALDSSKMAWVKVKDLGKHMLCISRTSCFSAVASKSCMKNRIYFSRFHGEGILFYSLDTGRYHSVGSQHSAPDFHSTKMQFNCTWIEPNWSRNTVQELEWRNVSSENQCYYYYRISERLNDVGTSDLHVRCRVLH